MTFRFVPTVDGTDFGAPPEARSQTLALQKLFSSFLQKHSHPWNNDECAHRARLVYLQVSEAMKSGRQTFWWRCRPSSDVATFGIDTYPPNLFGFWIGFG